MAVFVISVKWVTGAGGSAVDLAPEFLLQLLEVGEAVARGPEWLAAAVCHARVPLSAILDSLLFVLVYRIPAAASPSSASSQKNSVWPSACDSQREIWDFQRRGPFKVGQRVQ